MNTLITIAPSHYCEKARWGLILAALPFTQQAHLPLLHVWAVKRAGGSRSTPTLVTGDGTLSDSSDILEWIQTHPHAAWKPYGDDGEVARQARAWEERCDEKLGPATRRYAYFHLLPQSKLAKACLSHGVSRAQARLLPGLWPMMRGLMRRSMRIDRAGAARSRAVVDRVFDAVGTALASRQGDAEQLPGRDRFLCGRSFTAADLSFATLAAPLLLPEHYGAALPALESLPAELQSEIVDLRAHPAGQFAMRIYETQLAPRATGDRQRP